MKSVIGPVSLLAAILMPAHLADAHVFNFVFGMHGTAVVPPTDSAAKAAGLLTYNHHTFRYDLDLRVTGIALADLLDTGPNGTPIHIYEAPRGQTGPILLDPGYFGDFVQDGDAIRLTLASLRLGGTQGAFETSIFGAEEALYSGRMYIQIFTVEYPGGEIRGQIPPLNKFLNSDGVEGFKGLKGPPIRIPGPATPISIALAGILAARRRR